MSNPVVLGIAIANAPPEVNADEVMRFIEAAEGDFETYGLAPAPPGATRRAVFDFMVVLGATGSVASIAALLWMAYTRFVEPKKTSEHGDAGVYIGIRNPDGTVVDFWIGKTHNKEEILIADFTAKVTPTRESKDAQDQDYLAAAVTEIKTSATWVRRK